MVTSLGGDHEHTDDMLIKLTEPENKLDDIAP